jgi:hypothetical protein
MPTWLRRFFQAAGTVSFMARLRRQQGGAPLKSTLMDAIDRAVNTNIGLMVPGSDSSTARRNGGSLSALGAKLDRNTCSRKRNKRINTRRGI